MKKDYLSRLTWAARWRLPRAEADDVISDYREIISQRWRSDEELQRDLGKPSQAIRLVSQPAVYRRWLAVFALLAVLLLALPVSEESFLFRRYNFVWPILVLLLGTAVSSLWFRRQGVREGRFPRGLLPLLLVQAAALAFVWFIIWFCLIRVEDFIRLIQATNYAISGSTVHSCLYTVTILSVLAGIYGLIQARLGDRRWRAVYLFSLTLAALSMTMLALLTCMDMSVTLDWIPGFVWRYVVITAIGLAGTGVSLC